MHKLHFPKYGLDQDLGPLAYQFRPPERSHTIRHLIQTVKDIDSGLLEKHVVEGWLEAWDALDEGKREKLSKLRRRLKERGQEIDVRENVLRVLFSWVWLCQAIWTSIVSSGWQFLVRFALSILLLILFVIFKQPVFLAGAIFALVFVISVHIVGAWTVFKLRAKLARADLDTLKFAIYVLLITGGAILGFVASAEYSTAEIVIPLSLSLFAGVLAILNSFRPGPEYDIVNRDGEHQYVRKIIEVNKAMLVWIDLLIFCQILALLIGVAGLALQLAYN